MTTGTLYELLGISPLSTQKDIKNAYKTLAKKYHPDKNPNSPWHEEQFKLVNQAYQVLSNEERRSAYDLKIAYQNAYPSASPQTPYSPPPRKNTGAKKPTTKTSPKTERKIYFGVVVFFIIFGIAGYFVYQFMNQFSAEEAFKKGEEEFLLKNYVEAFEFYSEAISFNDKHTDAYEKRADTRIAGINDYAGASRDYTNALTKTIHPSGALYFKRAKCYVQLKKFNFAQADLDSALQLNPSLDSAYYYKAELYYVEESYKNAIKAYTTFLKKNTTAYDAYLNRGYSYVQEKKYSEAMKDFDLLIQSNIYAAESYYYKAFIHFELQDSTQGCKALSYAALFGVGAATEAQKRYCR